MKLIQPDFSIENHGSILLFRMNTAPAKIWIEEKILVARREDRVERYVSL
jgi:hypothetical protein